MANAFLSFVSATFGWIYFLAWSLSFYPQVILNWNRKTYVDSLDDIAPTDSLDLVHRWLAGSLARYIPSVEGLSFDFLNYNFLGFFSYSIFNAAFFWNKTVQGADRIHIVVDSRLCQLRATNQTARLTSLMMIAEYFAAHPGTDDIPVQANDVAFALQALAITTFTIFQCFIYKVSRSAMRVIRFSILQQCNADVSDT